MTNEGHAGQDRPKDAEDHFKYLFFLCLSFALILFAFLFNSPGEIWAGSVIILKSPANLLTDYFQLANIGAALVNVGLMTLLSLGLIRRERIKITGPVIAAVFTVAGFSFFGKNLYNSLPIILGVLLYAKAARRPFGEFILQCLFGTALSPLVSEFSFNIGLPLLPGMALGTAAGMLVGFVLPPLSVHFAQFHKGHSLYNIGFTAGIIGMIFMALLSGFGIQIDTVFILSSGHKPAFSAFLYALSALLIVCGLALNHWRFKGFGNMLKLPGVAPTDFTAISGMGPTLVNMGLLGGLSTSYVLVLGGELSGPVIGGIFTVIGFGAYGKHIRNVIPVILGVFIVNLYNIHDTNSAFALMTALFGTTLAPISGRYGMAAGILAGMLHTSLVSNISFLHAGMNLYNNGFSGGFIAAALHPLFDALAHMRKTTGD